MKKLALVLMSLVASVQIAQAAQVRATDDHQVNVTLIEDFKGIPRVGDLIGSVTTVYRGSAHALSGYVVAVGNTAAPCEGDDCVAMEVFELGNFIGAAEGVYSRQIDKNTYSIAILTTKADMNDDGELTREKAKILLTVKFTKNGVFKIADSKVVPR